MIQVVEIDKIRKHKNKSPIPKLLSKHKPKKDFDKLFREELKKLDEKICF